MSGKEFKKFCSKMNRRSFLKSTTIAAASLSINPSKVLAELAEKIKKTFPLPEKSIVAITKDKKSISDSFVIDKSRVRRMIDEGIKNMTGAKNLSEAWASVFPNLKDNEVIGLKVNTINPRIPAHPEVAYSIVDSMVEGGINKQNILIWDNVDAFLINAGYKINDTKEGYRCYGTYHDKSIWLDPEAKVYIRSENIVNHHSKILSQHIDYLINVPVLKKSEFAGVTLSMKNMYGTIHLSEQATFDPTSLTDEQVEVIEKMHAHNANPQIAEVNASEQLMKKTKLVVLDALMGIYEGSAHVDPQGVNHTIIISPDRVATDLTGMKIINEERKKRGKKLISKEYAGHIWSAEKLGIGNADESKIEVRMSELKTS
ncbi:MAG: DUF362 domain-containing protein [Candidatus Schekmanbacteria bacterium]|nr:MAG: DUF362 domain-containing protein [Candidatus Schekmanbacteria bacterium]